jgi:hypothetical protein
MKISKGYRCIEVRVGGRLFYIRKRFKIRRPFKRFFGEKSGWTYWNLGPFGIMETW